MPASGRRPWLPCSTTGRPSAPRSWRSTSSRRERVTLASRGLLRTRPMDRPVYRPGARQTLVEPPSLPRGRAAADLCVQIAARYFHLNGHEWSSSMSGASGRGSVHHPVGGREPSTDEGQRGEDEAGSEGRRSDRAQQGLHREVRDNLWTESGRATGSSTTTMSFARRCDRRRGEQKRMTLYAGKTSIVFYNQTDFLKKRVVVEVRSGSTGSFVRSFVKHLAFYVGDRLTLAWRSVDEGDAGAYVVGTGLLRGGAVRYRR